MKNSKELESKELESIRKAIRKWMDRHKGNCQFYVSFMAFKGKDFKVIDDFVGCYGSKDTIQMDLKELNKMIKEEKEDFINW